MHESCTPPEINNPGLLEKRSNGLVDRVFLRNNQTKKVRLLPLALPEPGLRLEQDAEWFLVQRDGHWQQIRFHDYATIYRVPGLYERLFYDILKCNSPTILRSVLLRDLNRAGMTARGLRILDLGAGNGMVGEQLAQLGVELLVGADIIEEAAQAARRDRPEVYDDYHVLDFTQLSQSQRKRFLRQRFNCLTCVAALGFGDIPAAAFESAFDLIEEGGWIAFTIKEEFVLDQSDSEFAQLIDGLVRSGCLNVLSRERYRHRFSTGGVPLQYICYVGRKRKSFENAQSRPASSTTG